MLSKQGLAAPERRHRQRVVSMDKTVGVDSSVWCLGGVYDFDGKQGLLVREAVHDFPDRLPNSMYAAAPVCFTIDRQFELAKIGERVSRIMYSARYLMIRIGILSQMIQRQSAD